MKRTKLYVFATILIALPLILSGSLWAQADEHEYTFVVFETTVTKQGIETSDAQPEERRFYVSNVIGLTREDQSRRVSKIADDYFTTTLVEPMKAKGILHAYYDDGIHINNGVVYRLDTREEVEDVRTKALADLKEQSSNIFTFTWAYGEKPTGLEMSRPTLYYHEPGKPLYGAGDTVTKPAPTQPKAVARVHARDR